MGYVQEARENHVKKKVEEVYMLNIKENGTYKEYQEAGENHVDKKVEALRSKMKQKALKECDQYTAKYAECARGKTLSVVWLCRKQANELNECLHQFTNDSVLEDMKKDYSLQQDKKGL